MYLKIPFGNLKFLLPVVSLLLIFGALTAVSAEKEIRVGQLSSPLELSNLSILTLTPDTIRYDNNTAAWLLTNTNVWTGVRFTPLSYHFELQAIYFAILNQYGNATNGCSLYVVEDDGTGEPDWPTGRRASFWVAPPLPNLIWIQVDLTSVIRFSANEDFHIIYGPAPGGPYPRPGWWNLFDSDSTTTQRSYVSLDNRATWTTITFGDAFIRAGGEYFAVVINEIRPWIGSTGVDSVFSFIELYNRGGSSQNLTGWKLGGASDSDTLSLPGWIIPAGCYLNIYLGPGTNDPDFSDSIASYYAGVVDWVLDPEADEVGLFNGPPSSGTVQDFVGWGFGTSSFGNAYTYALSRLMWPSGDFVDNSTYSGLAHIARIPSGYDRDVSKDWKGLEQSLVVPLTPHNAIQLFPLDGSLHDTVSALEWKKIDGASSYLLEVDDDSLFGSPSIDTTVSDTSYAISLPDNLYFWRVIPNLAGGPYPAAVWDFAIQSSLPKQQVAVPQRFQHKDTRLLCIYDLGHFQQGVARNRRPGCQETWPVMGPWDVAHPVGAHIPTCNHCNQYCTRASIQMVNAKYGGTLTKDEISYHFWQNAIAGPEGDLGHNWGAWPQHNSTYSWAMNGAAIGEFFIGPPDAPIPWGTLTAEINAGRPVLTVIRPPGWFHTVVFNGYEDNWVRPDYIHMMDPWPGRTGWYRHSRMPCVRYYILPAGALAGRATDPNVTADDDGDGVMNFDEQHPDPGSGQAPRTFCSVTTIRTRMTMRFAIKKIFKATPSMIRITPAITTIRSASRMWMEMVYGRSATAIQTTTPTLTVEKI